MVWVPSAGAAPTWFAPTGLSAVGQSATASQLAVDPSGDVVAVWQRSNGIDTLVEGAVRLAGGTWQAPVGLSQPGENAESPQVAIDSQGDATAVWRRSNGTNEIIEGSTRPAGGAWRAPVALSLAGDDADSPDVAVDPQGNAVAVWRRFDGSNYIVEAALRPASSGVWQTPGAIMQGGRDGQAPRVVMSANGTAVATWERTNGVNDIVEVAAHGANSFWANPTALSAVGEDGDSPQVAVDTGGDIFAVWQRSNGANLIIEGTDLPAAASSWQTPVDLSVAGQNASAPRIGVDQGGDAIAVWQRSNGANSIIEAAVRPVGGVWQEPMALSAPGEDAQAPEIGVDQGGDAVAVWQRSNGANSIVESAARPAGGAWQAPVALSAPGEDAQAPEIETDAYGDAVAVWQRSNGVNEIVEAAAYDVTGLVLKTVTMPTTGTVGQPLAFSVSPFDISSPIGTTSWSFGDGYVASGASVTHIYARAGTYRTTVTSTGLLGGVASAAGTVVIAPATVTPPPPVVTEGPPPPTLTGVSLSNLRFRVGGQATAISAASTPLGTSFRFTLSDAARLEVAIVRLTPGLRRGRSCVAPNATLEREHTKGCMRTLSVGRLVRVSEPEGHDSIAFSGRIGRRALSPAKYDAVLTASNAGGLSKPATLRFTIAR
jgi:hypothetical protein